MSFQIRQATSDDLDLLTPLFDAYRQFYGQSSAPDQVHHFLDDRLRRDDSRILIAHAEDGEGMGFTQLYPVFSSIRMVRSWLLNDLFVAAAARRQGVASALLRAAATHARESGVASLSLSTARDNVSAQSLYESLGWVRDRQFCGYELTL